MSWLQETSDGCILTVKATPRASRSEIVGPDPEWVRVRLQAPPADGQANAALVELLAREFGLAKQAVTLLSGGASRLKRVRLRGVSAARVQTRLTAAPAARPDRP